MLLSGIIGYFLGGSSSNDDSHNIEIDVLKKKNRNLERDLTACQKVKIKTPSSNPLKISGSNTRTVLPLVSSIETRAEVKKLPTKKKKKSTKSTSSSFNAVVAKEVFGKKIKADDLKIIEGIGPKIESLFHEDGIKTWKNLADSTQAQCKSVLEKGGSRFQMHDPKTWPKQAKLAENGKFKELKKLQDELDGGK